MVVLDHAFVQLHATDSIMLNANATFDSPLPARLDDLSLHLSGQEDLASLPAFINFSVPGFHVSSPTTHVQVVESLLRIANEADLVDWALRFVRDETIPISVLSDSLGVFLGRLPYSAHVNKTVLVKGLSTLDDITIPTLKLNLAAKNYENNNNLAGTIVLDNTSSLSILVGNITLNLLVGDIRIGTIYIPDVNLVPASNALPIVGNVEIGVIVANIGKILFSQQGVLQSGHFTVALTGNATHFNGQRIRFVDTILTARPLSIKIPLETLLNTLLEAAVDVGSGGRAEGRNISVSSLIGALSSTLANKTLIAGLQNNWRNSGSMKQPQGLGLEWPMI